MAHRMVIGTVLGHFLVVTWCGGSVNRWAAGRPAPIQWIIIPSKTKAVPTLIKKLWVYCRRITYTTSSWRPLYCPGHDTWQKNSWKYYFYSVKFASHMVAICLHLKQVRWVAVGESGEPKMCLSHVLISQLAMRSVCTAASGPAKGNHQPPGFLFQGQNEALVTHELGHAVCCSPLEAPDSPHLGERLFLKYIGVIVLLHMHLESHSLL